MTGWSSIRAAIAVALASTAAMPALAQDDWAPPPQSDSGWQQPSQYGDDQQGYDQQHDQRDDRWVPSDEESAAPDQGYADDQAYGDDQSSSDDQGNSDNQAYGEDDGQPAYHGGFASRDVATPAESPGVSPPRDEENGWGTWHSSPSASTAASAPSADYNNAPPEDHANAVPEAQRNGWPAPSGPGFTQPEAAPGFQASTGIDNRNQAVSSCLAAVRDRVGGGAGAARVDGINGDWMVSGAIDDGRAFYCSVRHGAIDDVQFGG